MTRSRIASVARRLARHRIALPLAVITIAVTSASGRAEAQAPPERPYLAWRTIRTPHFTLHYPPGLEAWATDVAARLEPVDSAVGRMVGYAPAERTEIVVDDPYALSNGFAIPEIGRPTITFWATPPSPRIEIGDVRTWPEMLAVHEFTHVAHLSRPSRNRFERLVWRLLPTDAGPIALRSPRWVDEGYATYVEGRITGSGRPNNAWRAAILRQWALEGRLPTYAEMSDWGAYRGGAFAYLAGSAFLEWLVGREGDSSLVHVWRRLSARQRRTFDEAFTGVFGDSPAYLYGRFAADVTERAYAARRLLAEAGLDTGAVVQHLSWETGDPALSPDGARVAIVIRAADRPSRVVVWSTAAEPDTTAARRDAALLKRDPEDVPAVRRYPPPKRALATLRARGGYAFDQPRFLGDGKRLLVVRFTPVGDGTVRPDLYLWNSADGVVRRLTRGAGVTNADPLPDARAAIAERCVSGHCDVVRVDLATGAVSPIAIGTVATSYYRPRVSPDGSAAIAAVRTAGRWRLTRIDLATHEQRFVDPDDGANRFDAAWLDPNEIVCASDQGGVANLERIDLSSGAAVPVTRVTGAAVAPAPDPRTHAVWFLSLHARGYDLRRLDSLRAAEPVVALPATLAPAARPRVDAVAPLPVREPPASRPYGDGVRGDRWLPGVTSGADGANATFAEFSSDVIGRLEILTQGTVGRSSAWRGIAIEGAWRGWRPVTRFAVFDARQTPSRASSLPTVGTAYDVDLRGGSLSLDGGQEFGSWAHDEMIGLSAARLRSADARGGRELVFGRVGLSRRHVGDGWWGAASLAAHGAAGRTADAGFTRGSATFAIAQGGAATIPLAASVTYGRTSQRAPVFEQFSLGGSPPPMLDRELLAERVLEPALPTGTAVGREVVSWRVSLPAGVIAPFYEGTSLGPPSGRRSWHRVYGLEATFASAYAPIVRLPGARIAVGVARSLDAPVARTTRGYAMLVWRP